jgi:glycogen synthase
MQNASILALTSRFEAFGLVIAEAMSTGLPVLATKCGGPDSMVPAYAGILVDCESVPSVFVGLKNMHTRYTDFDQEKIRRFAVRRFGRYNVARCYHEVIRAVLNGPPARETGHPAGETGNETAKDGSSGATEHSSKRRGDHISSEKSRETTATVN